MAEGRCPRAKGASIRSVHNGVISNTTHSSCAQITRGYWQGRLYCKISRHARSLIEHCQEFTHILSVASSWFQQVHTVRQDAYLVSAPAAHIRVLQPHSHCTIKCECEHSPRLSGSCDASRPGGGGALLHVKPWCQAWTETRQPGCASLACIAPYEVHHHYLALCSGDF